jgi:hypothetical protein
MKAKSEIWMDKPEAHDFLAPRDYLSLLLEAACATSLTIRDWRAFRRDLTLMPE